MFSQSLTAQLLRMFTLLLLTLIAVHHSESLMNLFAGQAMNSGCHQQGNQVEEQHLHHDLEAHHEAHSHHEHASALH